MLAQTNTMQQECRHGHTSALHRTYPKVQTGSMPRGRRNRTHIQLIEGQGQIITAYPWYSEYRLRFLSLLLRLRLTAVVLGLK